MTALYAEIIPSINYPTEISVIRRASKIGITLVKFEGWQATMPDGYDNQRKHFKSNQITENKKLLDLVMDACTITENGEFDVPQINQTLK